MDKNGLSAFLLGLGVGVGIGMLDQLKDGGGVSKPVANAADEKRPKGSRRDSLALGSGFRRSSQQ